MTIAELIAQMREERQALVTEGEGLVTTAAAEERGLTDVENARWQEIRTECGAIDARVTELSDFETRNREAAEIAVRTEGGGTPRVQVTREPLTYERHNRQVSYFRDLGLAYVGGDAQARERLQRHAREAETELPRLIAQRRDRIEDFSDSPTRRQRFQRVAEAERFHVERRDISRTDGAGGEFVPPLWLIEEYAEFARSGRVFVERCRLIPLPPGTDSINIPRITTGTGVEPQTADNAAVQETDIVTNSVAAPVRTIAGQQDVALQLLEQSPIMFDEVVFADLIAAYNEKLEAQALNGSAAAGQLQGVIGLAGTNTVTYTDATPTLVELYPKGADATQQAATNRKQPPSAHFMHPRRWFWMTAALDGQNRPLVVPNAYGAFNPMAVSQDVLAEGPVGSWHGLPVYMTLGIPANLGAGTNEDRILTARMMDILLFEGILRSRALPEVLSGTLTVRLQVYAYCAFTAGRFPTGISKIEGTGLVTPTF